MSLRAVTSALVVAALFSGSHAWADGAKPSAPPVPMSPRRAHAPAWMGMALKNAPSGVSVGRVFRKSPAGRAGVESGDVVVGVDGVALATAEEVIAAVRSKGPGEGIRLALRRGTATRTLDVSLEAMPSQDEMLRREWQGEVLPAAPLSAVRGTVPAKLDGLKGRVVVLAFEATWCGVCGAAQPILDGWQRRFGAQGLTVLGVDAEAKDLVASHVARQNAVFPVVVDAEEGGLTGTLGVSALPTLVILGKDGRVRDIIIGFDEARWAAAQRLVESLLDEKAPPMPSRG